MNSRIEGLLLPTLGALAIACSVPAQCPGMGGGPQVSQASGAVSGPGHSETTPVPAAAPSPAGPSAPGPRAPSPDRSGPTTGGPSGPAAAPSGPQTGGAGPAAASTPAARTGARGTLLTFAREATSKDRLKIDWRHPVPPARDDDQTSGAGALPLAEALQILWENDERPLLVLRECGYCQDNDQALLTRSLNNDRTLLLTKWFRVVRLPVHVTEPNHPFHNVFAGYTWKSQPHFYLLAHPGAQPVEFTGVQTQSSLWKGMTAVLAERYGRDANKAVKEWLLLLNEFDRFDASLATMQGELDETRAKEGPKSDKAKDLEKRLAEVKAQRGEALAREERIRDLRLLSMPKALAAVAGAK